MATTTDNKSTMKAIAYTSYGGPDVMEIAEFPVPHPGPSDVQVRVVGGGLNPLDYKERDGALKIILPFSFPAIAGNEFSGVVTATGANVTNLAVGDSIICRGEKNKMDCFSEYVVVPASICAKAPTSVSLVEAAGLPLAGLTANQAFDHLDLKAGDQLLITGGAGGVGLFAIQLAKLRGAIVTTTASAKGKPYVDAAGADHVIDYHSDKIPADKFDKCFDTIGGDALVNEVVPGMKRGGQIISVGGPPTPGCLDFLLPWWKRPIVNTALWAGARGLTNAAAARDVHYAYFFMLPSGEQLTTLAGYVDSGKLKIVIDSQYKLDNFRDAFKQLESGRSKGKVVIDFGGQ